MQLSEKARSDLVKILEKEIGPESVSMLNEKEIDNLGILFLTVMAEKLKMINSGKAL